MTSLTHIVTASAILLHSLLGCCTHEAHGDSGSCCGATHSTDSPDSSITEAEHSDCPFCKSHDTVANDETPSSAECGSSSNSHQPTAPHECHHNSCKWTAPRGEYRSDFLAFHSVFAITFSSEAPFAVLQEEWGGLLRLTPFASPHMLPVRRHLAKLVFLI